MFKIDTDKTIHLTRGDRATIRITANEGETFAVNDKFILSIVKKGNYKEVVFQKEYKVLTAGTTFDITLSTTETKIGSVISKPMIYWYEIEYNGYSTPTGYDINGAKQFILYPEAPKKENE